MRLDLGLAHLPKETTQNPEGKKGEGRTIEALRPGDPKALKLAIWR